MAWLSGSWRAGGVWRRSKGLVCGSRLSLGGVFGVGGGPRRRRKGVEGRRWPCSRSTMGGGLVTAELDTLACGGGYLRADEVLLDRARQVGGLTGEDARPGWFAGSQERFDALVRFLGGEESGTLDHAELETRLDRDGRELVRQLLQDHLDLHASRETRLDGVVDADGVPRRLAYRSRGSENLYPADGLLNLPAEKHSHGLRWLAAVESSRGSYDDTADAITRATGQRLGKRQVEQLAAAAAPDVEEFYAHRERSPLDPGDVLVLSCDGKGIVMRPDALRPATARQAAASKKKLKSRLSKGEKRNRKRIAEVGAVYDLTPAPRTSKDILPRTDAERAQAAAAPAARNKWLTASVVSDAAQVVARVFDEAQRRDPDQHRTWVALVDGNNHQIDRITHEAAARSVPVTILVDFVHVLEYLWKAAWCFHNEGDPAAEQWVHRHATRILDGNARQTATAIRRAATTARLTRTQRENADTCANYLMNKSAHLDYPTALRNGRPIATGVIEGACRHLVKDRMDITGARWGLHGAEAILKLRAVRANGDFDDYWTYHLAQERRRVHQSRYANGILPQE